MNPKKEQAEKAKNAGISLDPELKKDSTDLAKKLGFKSLSALTHKLLSDALAEAAQEAEAKGQQKIAAARKKKS